MRNSLIIVALGAVVLGISAFGASMETTPTDPVARGEYIANSVAMCVQCHSPHERDGSLIRGQHFEGQAFPVKSPYPDGQNWAPRAPVLKRLPGWSKEDFVHLLTTGARLDGHQPWRPMPPFRFSQQDADALYSYLMSL